MASALGSAVSNSSIFAKALSLETSVDVKATPARALSTFAGNVGGQVLEGKSVHAIEHMTAQQLDDFMNTSTFSESDSQVMMAMFQTAVAQQEKGAPGATGKDPVNDLMSFDPTAWEKHVGVLVATIVAINIARQVSGELSGKFVQMAYESAQAQGIAIMNGGEAAMWAAVTGSVVSATMAGAGSAISIKGNIGRHADQKNNLQSAMKSDKTVVDLQVQAQKGSAIKVEPGATKVTGTNAKGEVETIELNKNTKELSASEAATLEADIRKHINEAKESRMASALQQKSIDNKLVLGGALSSLAMITSAGLSSILRLNEYAERQKEVLNQAEQNINKSVSDSENQSSAEDASLIAKMLDAIQSLVDGRNATVNAIASARA